MRPIDADALYNLIDGGFDLDFSEVPETKAALLQMIADQDTIEPERKKGKWEITDAYPHNVHCSICHKKFAQTHWVVWEDGSLPRNYCPNCGADMRGEEDETD